MILVGLAPRVYADQAMVFVDKEAFASQWPDCVQQIRKVHDDTVFRVWYPGGSGCYESLSGMAGVVYVEKSLPMFIPGFLSTPGETDHTCVTLAGKNGLVQLDQGNKVVVAVIDTGIALSVFGGSVAKNLAEIAGDGIDNDQNGYVDDVNGWDFSAMKPDIDDIHGHGTQVSSIVLSIAPNAGILPVKVTSGMEIGFSSIDAAEAIYYAVARGADILNLSFSTSKISYAIYSAITYAVNAGSLVIAAAGNDGNAVQFPASMDDVIAVGSHDSAGNPSWFSPSGTAMDVLGPGENICATGLDGAQVSVSGTSFSTPAVSGMAAVLRSMNPNLGVASLKNMVFMGTHDILTPGFDEISGYGKIDPAGLVSVVTPWIDVPAQIDKGIMLNVALNLPPTDCVTDIYLTVLYDNTAWWMNGARLWFRSDNKPFAPFSTLSVTNFMTQKIYGMTSGFNAIDTSLLLPGKYLWAAGLFDKNGNQLAPIGWKKMELNP
jgi:hypothetical protein